MAAVLISLPDGRKLNLEVAKGHQAADIPEPSSHFPPISAAISHTLRAREPPGFLCWV